MKPLTWMRLVRDNDANTATRKHIAYAVALRADVDGHCWPSYNTIAADTDLHRVTVIRHIDGLVSGGWLIKTPRANGHGSQSNAYLLSKPSIANGGSTELPGGVAQDYHPSSTGLPGGLHRTTPWGVAQDYPEENASIEVKRAPALSAILNGMGRDHRIPR
jgi:helix-turn-helix protein